MSNNYARQSFLFLSILFFVSLGCSKSKYRISSIGLNCEVMKIAIGESRWIEASITPMDIPVTERVILWSSSSPSVVEVSSNGLVTGIAAGSATIVAKCGGKSTSCTVVVIDMKMVDLGLSVKWADRNIGAKRQENTGGYYAWGEIEPKSDYSWSTYKWSNGAWNKLFKYNTLQECGFVDNKTRLDLSDDVVNVMYGGKWRIPSIEEFKELFEKCNWKWTTLNGVKGYEVISKTNGNSIFMPVTGGILGKELQDTESGSYWTSTLMTKVDYSWQSGNTPYYACLIFFDSEEKNWTHFDRTIGRAVRPVLE